MNETQEIAVAEKPEPASVEVPHVHVFARNQEEMQRAQGGLARWFEMKGAAIETELQEANANLATAKASGWRLDAWKRIVTGLERRREFYAKGLVAIQAGYTIIPSLDIDVFAIRTERESPKPLESTASWQDRDQQSEAPAIGAGRYVDATPSEYSEKRITETDVQTGKEIVKTFWRADEFLEVDFPFRFAKTAVLDATQQAMALQVFDEIGVLPGRRAKKGDPMVVGRIILRGQGQRRTVDFLIAWFIDTNDLP